MAEKLSIRNFGPLQKADITLRELALFVGPQATGKSLTAQILYFFRRLESLVYKRKINSGSIEEALENWLGTSLSVYAQEGTVLRWEHPDFVNGELQEICWTKEGIVLNQSLLNRQDSDRIEAEVYIPAGRVLYAFLPPYAVIADSRFLQLQDWPGYISDFYGILGRTVRWLYENKENIVQTPQAQFLRSRIRKVLKGDIEYGHETVSLKMGAKTISSMTMAGGQMAIWPFWAIVEGGLSFNRLKSARIYIDEPEAHLHPAAQKLIMEMIAYLVQQDTQFVLMTHSPYLLYTVNLFLQAYQIYEAGHSLPDSIPHELVLSPDQVSAYRFAADGTVHDIKDTEIGLIDEEELDRVADDLGAVFTELLEEAME